MKAAAPAEHSAGRARTVASRTVIGRTAGWHAQFRGLRGRHPAMWPVLPRALCALAVLVAVMLAGWQCLWQPQWADLAAATAQEQQLRTEFIRNAGRASDLDRLRRRRDAAQAQVDALQRQLPGRADMDALLSEINHAGVARGLQFELFKPGKEQLFDYYAELPIDIKVTGSFHAMAGFASDLANLSRIVTLDRISITQGREGLLAFEGVARTFRYLDSDELAARARLTADNTKRDAR